MKVFGEDEIGLKDTNQIEKCQVVSKSKKGRKSSMQDENVCSPDLIRLGRCTRLIYVL